MIISHKYKFIFLKSRKTAGTSVEHYFHRLAGQDDVMTPIANDPYQGQNHRGIFNPLKTLLMPSTPEFRRSGIILSKKQELCHALMGIRYFEHIPAAYVRKRVPKHVWDGYFKFTIERDPWDKTLSYYFFKNEITGARHDIDYYIERRQLPFNFPYYTSAHDPSEVIVDRVIRYENLQQELQEVFGLLGVPFSGLRARAKGGYRKKGGGRDLLTPERVDAIGEAFHAEISLMEYKPPAVI